MIWAALRAWAWKQCEWCHHPAVLGAVTIVGVFLWYAILQQPVATASP